MPGITNNGEVVDISVKSENAESKFCPAIAHTTSDL